MLPGFQGFLLPPFPPAWPLFKKVFFWFSYKYSSMFSMPYLCSTLSMEMKHCHVYEKNGKFITVYKIAFPFFVPKIPVVSQLSSTFILIFTLLNQETSFLYVFLCYKIIRSIHKHLQIFIKIVSDNYQFIRIMKITYNQNTKGNATSSPAEKTDSPDVSVTLKLAPSHPFSLMIPFMLPSSDVKASSPFPLSIKLPLVSPCL